MHKLASTLAMLLFALLPCTTFSFQTESEFTDLDMLKSAHEKSFVLALSGWGLEDNLFFEANIAPHLVMPFRTGIGGFAFDLTPKFIVRMWDEYSRPVRTPSYMPRLTLYHWWQTDPMSFSNGERFSALFFTISHHSNGQAGPFFNTDGTVNHQDGDFSTNFLELGLYSARPLLSSGVTQKMAAQVRQLSRFEQFGQSVSVEWHPGFNQSEELRGRYGIWRLNLRSSLFAEFGAVSMGTHAQLTTLFGPVMYSKWYHRLIVSAGAIVMFPGLEDFGAYANFYTGQDYYNIRFDKLITSLRLGFIMNFTTVAGK